MNTNPKLCLYHKISLISSISKKLVVPFGINTKYKLRNKVILNIGTPIDITNIEKNKQTEYLEEKVKELVLKKN